jgi:phosphatidylinositol glycan class Q protein
MPEHDGLMRIFWPLDIPRSNSPGIIVGWRNSGLDVFVVAILEDVDVSTNFIISGGLTDFVQARNVENALKVGTLFRNASHPIERLYALCGQSSMHVLGLANSPGVEVESLQMHATTRPNLRTPQVSCARATTIQIIMFDRPLPTRMQYISLNPISLALDDKSEMAIHAPGSVDAEEEREEMKNRKRTRGLVDKLKLHTVTNHRPSQKELALQRIVNQINCSWELHKLLQKNISLVGRRSRRSLSVSERVVESATTMRDFMLLAIWQIITVYIYPILRRGFVVGLLCHRVIAEALLLALEWRAKPDYAALKDISATAQQVEIRLQQFCYWPYQVFNCSFLFPSSLCLLIFLPSGCTSGLAFWMHLPPGWTCLRTGLPLDAPTLWMYLPSGWT